MKTLDNAYEPILDDLTRKTYEARKLNKKLRELKQTIKAEETELLEAMGRAKTAKLKDRILEKIERARKAYTVPETSWIELKIQ